MQLETGAQETAKRPMNPSASPFVSALRYGIALASPNLQGNDFESSEILRHTSGKGILQRSTQSYVRRWKTRSITPTRQEPHELLKNGGLLSKSRNNVPSRAGSVAGKLVKEAKKNAEQEELEKVKLGQAELANILHLEYLGVMQSSDIDLLVAVYHRI